jgi:hypothetical protein
MYWQRVTIEDSTEVQTATGNPRREWTTFLADVEARVLPLVVDERAETWATPEEDAYEVQLRVADPDTRASLRPRMRVRLDDGSYLDVRRIALPPPFADPTVVLRTVRVTP